MKPILSCTLAVALAACGDTAGTIAGTEPTPFGEAESSIRAPRELRLTELAPTKVSLAWKKGSSATVAFRVWRGDANFSKWAVLGEVAATQLAFTDGTVVAGTTYTYGVRALDDDGDSSDGSNVVVAIVPKTSQPPVCVPTTCAALGANCGALPDGCGGTLTCGTCTAPQSCGGAGVANVCGAQPPMPGVSGTFERPFPKADWLYAPIPATAKRDPNEAAMKAKLNAGVHSLALQEFAIPFYKATPATPRLAVDCIETTWGPCVLENNGPRPLTQAFVPHTGSDGAMVVIDESPRTTGLSGRSTDEYWQYQWNGGAPRTQWGGISDLDGDGRNAASTGAGISRGAGIVRGSEIAAGVIEHALVFATQYCQTGVHRFPASKNDGKYSGVGAVPEGVRVQLDPTLNPDAYGLNKGERAIFVALQKYGAYNIDCSGAPMSFSFEDLPGNPGTAYEQAGLTFDYYDLAKLPWDKLFILASWNGQ